MRFENKVAIISGGSEGMGKAAALGFAKEGASVVITSRSEEKLKKAVDEIQAAGGNVTAAPGDVTKYESIKAVVAKAVEKYGKVDILYNYVGGEPGLKPMQLFTEQTEEYWDTMWVLNLKSTIMFCRAVLDGMIERKYGKIINTAAMAGRSGGPRMVLYSAVKGGVIAFTKALAMEVGPHNINVNCVSPGPVNTPGYRTLFGEQAAEGPTDFLPMRRIGRPEDIGNAVLYLASDDASYITGQTLAVDGGGTMV